MEFVWDDVFLIRDNPDMKELDELAGCRGDYYQQGSDTRSVVVIFVHYLF